MKRWWRKRGLGSGEGGREERAISVASRAPEQIEYLVRANDGNSWDLLIDDLDALMPSSFRAQVLEQAKVLTVRCGTWSVAYSAEDPGWQLSFDASTNQVDAWRYATEVAAQLTSKTGVAATAVQIAGFDGGIFHCDESFGIESRDLHVLAGTIVHGDIEPSMNVSFRLNSSTAVCLRIDDIEEIRDPGGGSRLALTRACTNWDEVEFLLSFGVKNEYLEVSHRPCDDKRTAA